MTPGTLTRRFASRIRETVDLHSQNLDARIADADNNEAWSESKRLTEYKADLASWDCHELAEHVVRIATRYANALLPDDVRELVLEHPEFVSGWPLSTGTNLKSQTVRFDGPAHVHNALVELGLLSGWPWPASVSPAEAASLLERIPNDPDAVVVASALREGRKTLAYFLPVTHSPSSRSRLIHGAGVIFSPSEDRWEPLAVAALALAERRVREDGALYRTRVAVGRVLELYGDKLEAHVADAVGDILADDEKHGRPASIVDEHARRELASALRRSLTDLGKQLAEHPLRTEEDATALEGGVLWLDEAFARHVERTGEQGKLEASDARARSRERAERGAWREAFARWERDRPIALAVALWRDEVKPELEEARRKPASLVRKVYAEATLFHSRGPEYDEKNATLTFEGKRLAERVGATFDLEVIQKGLGLLGSVVSHELFHWEVTQGHEQARLNMPTPHVLEIEGGWVALAERLGLSPSKHAANLRALVVAQRSFEFFFPDGSKGNLLVLNERPAKGQRRAHVRIELGSALMPNYVYGMPGRERKLVPLLRERVPLYGRANEHGEQRTLSLAVVAELRDHARELVEEGGAKFGADDWTRLADRSGLPRKLIRPVVDHWLAGDTRAPAFLKRIERDRYTLSDVHAPERDFLEEGGRQEVEGQVRGKASVARRRRKGPK